MKTGRIYMAKNSRSLYQTSNPPHVEETAILRNES